MARKKGGDNDGKRKGRISEAEHLANVRAAYVAKMRHPKRRTHPNTLAQLRLRPRHDLPLIRRKCSAKRRDGGACKAPAVTGGDRCWVHGGRYQAPQARGNIKRLLDGRQEAQAAYKHNRALIDAAPPEARAAVTSIAARSDNLATLPQQTANLADGVTAWEEAQTGAPARWSQWIKAQPGVQAALDARPRRPWQSES